jgi:hypothetical protein
MFPLSNDILHNVLSYLYKEELKILLQKLRSSIDGATTANSSASIKIPLLLKQKNIWSQMK